MDSAIFTGVHAQWLPLYEQLHRRTLEKLGAFEVRQTTNALLWRHASAFARVSARKEGLVVAVTLDALHDEWKPLKTQQTARNRVAHTFMATDEAALPALVERIAQAYALTQSGRPPKALAEKEPVASVEAYIALFPPDVQRLLERVRQTIRGAAPEAIEKIAWQMPTFWQKENLIHFAAAKGHIGLYPGESGVRVFADRLKQYKTSKGAIQFPLSEPMPYDLIAEITRFRVREAQGQTDHGEGRKA